MSRTSGFCAGPSTLTTGVGALKFGVATLGSDGAFFGRSAARLAVEFANGAAGLHFADPGEPGAPSAPRNRTASSTRRRALSVVARAGRCDAAAGSGLGRDSSVDGSAVGTAARSTSRQAGSLGLRLPSRWRSAVRRRFGAPLPPAARAPHAAAAVQRANRPHFAQAVGGGVSAAG